MLMRTVGQPATVRTLPLAVFGAPVNRSEHAE
jgi:hypothetical protein